MRDSVQFPIQDKEAFIRKLCSYFKESSHFCLLNNNHFTLQNKAFDNREVPVDFEQLIGVGSLGEVKSIKGQDSLKLLKDYHQEHSDWMMGYISYDLKNELTNLRSKNHDGFNLDNLKFFIPRFIFMISKDRLEVMYSPTIDQEVSIKELIHAIQNISIKEKGVEGSVKMKQRISKEQYLETIQKLKAHLQRGDIYELNFCQEFYSDSVEIDPIETYFKLNRKSPAPFSVFLKIKELNVISASPERYLKKIGSKIITQPIKGTAKRGKSEEEDEKIKSDLTKSEKERSENVMIVDLCRNDLSRFAKRASVKVEELFGAYTFPQVHQLISTISADLREGLHFTDAIRLSFPMGSMTGAPKIRAMELIEDLESSKRGVYSGSVGFITPEGDFDLNVIIRSMIYDEKSKYLSASVGGAITILSEPEEEYEECMLKASAMLSVLDSKTETHLHEHQ